MSRCFRECGFPLTGDETFCPECGCRIVISTITRPLENRVENPGKPDRAQYFYECGVIGWEAFKKYCVFTGRASRREYWSFMLLCLLCGFAGCGIIFLLPYIGVTIRRMHDIGKCGWCSLVQFACFFLLFKRSDEGMNKYGLPNPAENLL